MDSSFRTQAELYLIGRVGLYNLLTSLFSTDRRWESALSHTIGFQTLTMAWNNWLITQMVESQGSQHRPSVLKQRTGPHLDITYIITF